MASKKAPNPVPSLVLAAVLSMGVSLCLVSSQACAETPSPLGDWSRSDGRARVHIAPCGQDLCAVNTWIRPDNREEKVGDKLIMTVTPAGTEWTGKAFDPQRKLTYRLSMRVSGKTMTTRGCVLGGLVCKGTAWTRTEVAA